MRIVIISSLRNDGPVATEGSACHDPDPVVAGLVPPGFFVDPPDNRLRGSGSELVRPWVRQQEILTEWARKMEDRRRRFTLRRRRGP